METIKSPIPIIDDTPKVRFIPAGIRRSKKGVRETFMVCGKSNTPLQGPFFLVVGGLIFMTGLPSAHYAATYGVDIDLLTRGAGFGYIGSTGRSTGSHLHYEILANGQLMNPLQLLTAQAR